MFKRLTFKTLNFALLATLVLSKSINQCKELEKYVEKNEKSKEIIKNCETNKNGEIIDLKLSAFNNDYEDLKPETVKKIFSHNSIKTLKYFYSTNTIKLEQFPINKLTNLKDLTIFNGDIGEYSEGEGGEETEYWYRGDIAKKVIKSIPKSVKKLNFGGLNLTQKNIDELATLTHVEDLTLRDLNLNELKLNFDVLKQLNKVKKLGIIEESKILKPAFKVVTKFPNVKELELEGSLHYLKPFDNKSLKVLKNLKSLKSLKVYMKWDDILSMKDICSLTNIEKVYNDDNQVAIDCTSSGTKTKTTTTTSSKKTSSKKTTKTSKTKTTTTATTTVGKSSTKKTTKTSKTKTTTTISKTSTKKTTKTSKTKSTTTKSKTSSKKTKTNSSIPTSTNGRCGRLYGKCPTGCCSPSGWCGNSEKHCGSGCQSEFGKCN